MSLITQVNHGLEMLQCVLQGESSLADNKTSAECVSIQWEKGGEMAKNTCLKRVHCMCT